VNTIAHSRSVEQKRKRPRTACLSPTAGFLALLCLLALICGTALVRTRNEYQAARAEYLQVEAEVKKLQLENERLQEEIRELKSDPQVIERIAREQLHMIRPDEMVISFPDAQKK